MKYILRGANVFLNSVFIKKDILISDGIILDISTDIRSIPNSISLNLNNLFIFPGFVDVHVHLREPGFFYKETIKTGTKAAAHGGFTSVCAMPNLNPVPDCVENLDIEMKIIERDSVINVYPYGSITEGEKQITLSDMENISDKVIAYSDDGVGVKSAKIMKEAMIKAKSFNKMIVAHCEVIDLVNGASVHDGKYAKRNSLKGNPSESEWKEVERDIDLVRKTGCKLHICHISTKESVNLIREAKREGLPVTCETAPHYLILCEDDLIDEGRFKMNPPLRDKEDKEALIKGIKDGTVDIIATDHAPHSQEEKSRGLGKSLNGIVGLETAFPILYTKLVKTGEIKLEKLIELMHINPSKLFEIGTKLEIGQPADITVFDLEHEYKINPNKFLSKGKSTPFEGEMVFGECKMTMCNGNIAYADENLKEVL